MIESQSAEPQGDGVADAVRGGSRARWIAAGGVLGALGASSCCILPLVLFSLGLSGAWVGNLTALEPVRPLFIAVSLGFLGYGFWLVYRPAPACQSGSACARPVSARFVKLALWGASTLILLAIAWPWIAPIVAPIMLGL